MVVVLVDLMVVVLVVEGGYNSKVMGYHDGAINDYGDMGDGAMIIKTTPALSSSS